MFGWIQIDKMELKLREYYQYKGYYCGLCRAMKEEYGELSRLSLNYDVTFLALVLSSLYEPEQEIKEERCLLHPTKKQIILKNEEIRFGAGVNILLAYYNLLDDWNDEKDVKGLVGSTLLKKNVRKARERYPEVDKAIVIGLSKLAMHEKDQCPQIETVGNTFGEIMGQIFSYKKDQWKDYLYTIGFNLGKIIYTLDAIEDQEKDKKSGAYNPLNIQQVDKTLLYNMILYQMSLIDESMDMLPLIQDKGIIDNILYAGLMNKMKSQFNLQEETDERSI